MLYFLANSNLKLRQVWPMNSHSVLPITTNAMSLASLSQVSKTSSLLTVRQF